MKFYFAGFPGFNGLPGKAVLVTRDEQEARELLRAKLTEAGLPSEAMEGDPETMPLREISGPVLYFDPRL
jgi:hypothetical protein